MRALLSFLLFSSSFVFAQSELDFISSYNEHLDPYHQLDTIHVLLVTNKLAAKGVLNGNSFDFSDDIKECKYYANGDQRCVVSGTGRNMDMNFIPKPKNGYENAIKDQLNFIAPGDPGMLSFRLRNDSITVIEKRLQTFQKFIYTFNSKTKDLLQVDNLAVSKSYSSVTRFVTYQNMGGIVVPERITFSNTFCEAILEYADVSFK
jgi:hypothetical protein